MMVASLQGGTLFRTMRLLDNRFYWWLSRLSSYLLLSGLWLLCSSLIVTLFPATAAMFAVFRAWQDNPDDAFYGPFFARFRSSFLPDFLLGLLWLLIPALLAVNFILLPQLALWLRPLLFALVLLGAVLYLAASVFLFPLRVSTTLGPWAAARTALILGMTQLGTTALCTGVLLLTAVAFWLFPASLLLSVAAAGHVTYRLCQRRLKAIFT